MSAEFKEGGLYYRVTFPDRDMCYPQIESLVYVGKNLSDEDREDTWYFQFSSEYARHGSILTSKKDGLKVCLATTRDLGDFLDLRELSSSLTEAAMRLAKSK